MIRFRTATAAGAAVCLAGVVLLLPGDSGAAPGPGQAADPVTQQDEPATTDMVSAAAPRDRIPPGQIHDGVYTRTIRLSITAPGGTSMLITALDGARPDGNGRLTGRLPAAAPLCFDRPVAVGASGDGGGAREQAVAKAVAAAMGVRATDDEDDDDDNLSLRQVWTMMQSPESSTFAHFGGQSFDAMLSELYGMTLNFPKIETMLTGGSRPATASMGFPCSHGRLEPNPRYDSAFTRAAQAQGFTVSRGDAAGTPAGYYFLVPGIVPAYVYQYLRLNTAPPALHVAYRSAPVVNLPTQFYVADTDYPVSKVHALVTEGGDVTITAVPHLILHFYDDGTDLDCGSIGSTKQQADPVCGHVYRSPGDHRVSARVAYDVHWGGTAGVQIDTGDTSVTAVPVVGIGEVQVVN